MCTAISYKTNSHYFGRTLDLEYSYNEQVVITARDYPLKFRNGTECAAHPAIIGIATVSSGYPLYYDAVNEHGLCAAALNFPESAYFTPQKKGADNVAPFEVIPWILSKCRSVNEVEKLMKTTHIANISFSSELPVTPLHWIVADSKRSIVIEPLRWGIIIADNPIGVLTNDPPFEYHTTNLTNYMNLTAETVPGRFARGLSLLAYSRGMGAIGLPGDFSSASRFVRAAFCKLNSICEKEDEGSISEFFHVLASVEQPRGCNRLCDGKNVITVYTSCCDATKGVYYYITYGNRQISAVDMRKESLESKSLICYPLITEQQIKMQN